MEKLGISERDPAVDKGHDTRECPVCGTCFAGHLRQCPYCDWKPGVAQESLDDRRVDGR